MTLKDTNHIQNQLNWVYRTTASTLQNNTQRFFDGEIDQKEFEKELYYQLGYILTETYANLYKFKDLQKIEEKPIAPIQTIKGQIITFADGRMTGKDAADYLGLKEKTLAIMRTNGTGPAFIKRGRIFYYKEDLDKWLNQNGRTTTTAQAMYLAKKS